MDITQLFLSGAKDCKQFTEASDIVKKNSFGKAWLIGGFVYRTIASQLYGLPKPDVDLDFIVENHVSDFDLPDGWAVNLNRYGNPKFVYGKKQIDFVPLKNIYSILQRNLEPTIENYLTGVPFTIQSIAFDVYDCLIIGEVGIAALKKRIVEVNNLSNAKYSAQKKNKALTVLIQEKADSLGFSAIFP